MDAGFCKFFFEINSFNCLFTNLFYHENDRFVSYQ